jgi:hypothetical protein
MDNPWTSGKNGLPAVGVTQTVTLPAYKWAALSSNPTPPKKKKKKKKKSGLPEDAILACTELMAEANGNVNTEQY